MIKLLNTFVKWYRISHSSNLPTDEQRSRGPSLRQHYGTPTKVDCELATNATMRLSADNWCEAHWEPGSSLLRVWPEGLDQEELISF